MAFVSQPKQGCTKKLEHLTSGAFTNEALCLCRQVSVDAGNNVPNTIPVSKGTITHRMRNLIMKKKTREKEDIVVIEQHLLKEHASIML